MVRLQYIDIIKLFAIVMVIICHTTAIFHVDKFHNQIEDQWFVLLAIGRMGVPLFMMCTGVLVLKKRFCSISDILKFYRNNLLTIYITGVIWCFIYLALTKFHNDNTITGDEFTKTLTLQNKPEVHLWYIRMILMYYLCMPLLSYLIHKHRIYILTITAIFAILTFVKNGYEILIIHNDYPTTSGLSLSCYLVYLVLGYSLTNIKNIEYNSLMGKATFLLIFLIGIGLTVTFQHMDFYHFVWYDNPFIFIASIGFFLLIKSLFENKTFYAKVITELSNMTFGVYLCHMIAVIYLAPLLLDFQELNNLFGWLLITVVTLLSSIFLVHICHKMPIFSRVFLRY